MSDTNERLDHPGHPWRPLMGVLIGGQSRRMGGLPKGLLDAGDGQSIVERSIGLGRSLGLEVVVVGDLASYDTLGVRRIADAVPGGGPLAGIVALLVAAGGCDAIAVACDMPRVLARTLERLAALPRGTTAAPRINGVWQPLLARWGAGALGEARARLERGERALYALLETVGAGVLPLDDEEVAGSVDWDSPADRTSRRSGH